MGNEEIKNKIVGIIVAKLDLVNISPVMLGNGEEEESDKDFICTPQGKPYIPGSSIKGKIKRLLKERYLGNGQFDLVFGSVNNQSHLIFDDATLTSNYNFAIRDGVKIDHQSNLAEDKGKFDYQVLEPDATFSLNLELKIRESFDYNICKSILGATLELIHQGIVLGGGEKSGMGHFEATNLRSRNFDFRSENTSCQKDRDDWFKYIEAEVPHSLLEDITEYLSLSSKKTYGLRITSTFSLQSTLLTGSYAFKADEPDKVQLRLKNGNYILSGSSIRGALRHRAVRVLNTLGKNGDLVPDLFGDVDKETKVAKKSRLMVHEINFKEEVSEIKQTRIKIDRFTGGTMDTALQEAQAVTKKSNSTFNMVFEVKNHTPKDLELLLYLLKDLMSEDLAIGGDKNVGRGRLKGIKSQIEVGNKCISLTDKGISRTDFEELKNHLPTHGN